MSRFSNVRIVTTPQGYETVCATVDATEFYTENHLLSTDTKPPVYQELGKSVMFGWDNVVWNCTSSDVSAVESALDVLAYERIPYQFCRLGEEYGDCDFTMSGDYSDFDAWVAPEQNIRIDKSYF